MQGGVISEAWEIKACLKKEENASVYIADWRELSHQKSKGFLSFNNPPTALPLPGVQYGSLVSLAQQPCTA